MTHDFKAAIEHMEHARTVDRDYAEIFGDEIKTIIFALNLSEIVTSEPTREMRAAGLRQQDMTYEEHKFPSGECGAPQQVYLSEAFKAMINEAKRAAEGDSDGKR